MATPSIENVFGYGSTTKSQASTQRTSSTRGGALTDATSSLGKNEFLNLLVAQLRNQDPLRPMEDKEFIAQLAQFSVLEQMQQMNQTLAEQREVTMLGQLSSWVGKNVVVADPANQGTFEGVVTSVRLVDGQPLLMVGNRAVDPKDVVAVGSVAGTPGSQSAGTV